MLLFCFDLLHGPSFEFGLADWLYCILDGVYGTDRVCWLLRQVEQVFSVLVLLDPDVWRHQIIDRSSQLMYFLLSLKVGWLLKSLLWSIALFNTLGSLDRTIFLILTLRTTTARDDYAACGASIRHWLRLFGVSLVILHVVGRSGSLLRVLTGELEQRTAVSNLLFQCTTLLTVNLILLN